MENLLRSLWASLCQFIYQLIAWLYELFTNISRVELLTNEDITPIYQRITMILTIVMVFYVTFEAVKYVVQPNNFTDKEKGGGKLVYKMILVVVLIAFVPKIFDWGYKLQNVVFDNQLFSKIILGKSNVDTNKLGRVFSGNVFSMFYYADEATWDKKKLEEKDNCEGIPCATIVNANVGTLVDYGDLSLLHVGLNEGEKKYDESTGEKVFKYYIRFDGLLAVIVGGIICYVLALYCVDIGARVVQLTYLQLIAPIAIIGYISPKKDGIFKKWVGQCTTTYLDLFLRTGIIYFGLLLCQIVGHAYKEGTIFNNIPGDVTTTMKTFIYIAIILGLLLFTKKAPKLLGELFPQSGIASGNLGLGLKDRFAMPKIVARTAGAALGSSRAVGGAIARGAGRYLRNRANGQKSILTKEGREQWKQRKENRQEGRQARKELSDSKPTAKKYENLNQAKAKVATAKKALEEAKTTGNQTLIKQRENELKKAGTEYANAFKAANPYNWTTEMKNQRSNYVEKRTNLRNAEDALRKAEASGDADAIRTAKSNLATAKNEFKIAETNYTTELKKGHIAGESLATRIENAEKQRIERQALEQQKNLAQQEYDRIKDSGTEEEIAAKQKAFEEAGQNLENYLQNSQENIALERKEIKTNLDKRYEKEQEAMQRAKDAEVRLRQAEEQIAIDQNQRYGSVVGATIAGAVHGGVTGIKTGAQATNLKEVFTKTGEAWKKDAEHVRNIHKFQDAGGALGVRGALDKTTAKIESTVGLDSSYQKRLLDTKKYDIDIKAIDTKMSLTKDAASTIGSGEDRLKSKVSELKLTADKNTAIKTVDANGNEFILKAGKAYDKEGQEYKLQADGNYKTDDGKVLAGFNKNDLFNEGDTLGSISRKYDAAAEFAKNEAASASDTAAKLELEAKKAQMEYDEKALKTNISEEEKQEAQKRADVAKATAEQAAKEAQKKAEVARNKEFAAEMVRKNTARAEYTAILQDPKASEISAYDQVAVQEIKKAKTSIALAAADPKLREEVHKTLYETFGNARGEDLYKAFVSGNIMTFDDIDDIKTAIINTENALGNQKKELQEQKRFAETNMRAQQEQAAGEFVGNK